MDISSRLHNCIQISPKFHQHSPNFKSKRCLSAFWCRLSFAGWPAGGASGAVRALRARHRRQRLPASAACRRDRLITVGRVPECRPQPAVLYACRLWQVTHRFGVTVAACGSRGHTAPPRLGPRNRYCQTGRGKRELSSTVGPISLVRLSRFETRTAGLFAACTFLHSCLGPGASGTAVSARV